MVRMSFKVLSKPQRVKVNVRYRKIVKVIMKVKMYDIKVMFMCKVRLGAKITGL